MATWARIFVFLACASFSKKFNQIKERMEKKNPSIMATISSLQVHANSFQIYPLDFALYMKMFVPYMKFNSGIMMYKAPLISSVIFYLPAAQYHTTLQKFFPKAIFIRFSITSHYWLNDAFFFGLFCFYSRLFMTMRQHMLSAFSSFLLLCLIIQSKRANTTIPNHTLGFVCFASLHLTHTSWIWQSIHPKESKSALTIFQYWPQILLTSHCFP